MAFQSKLGVSEATLIGSTMVAGMPEIDLLDQSISHSLGLLSFTGPLVGVSQDLNLNHSALFLQVVGENQNVSHSLGLTQEADPGTFQNLTDDLGLTQDASAIVFGPILQSLNIVHAVTYAGPVPASAADALGLTHRAGIAFDVSLTHPLGITDFATDVQKHDLGLTDLAMGYLNASPNFFDNLMVVAEVQVSAAYVAIVEDSNVVTDGVTYYIDDGGKCFKNQYNVFGTLPELPFTVGSGAKLAFTNITGTESMVFLRNPELDDRDRFGYTRINRESRGGELQVFRDPTWPTVNTLQGTVVGLKVEDMEDFLQFLEDHLGEEISLNDWHGRYWRGVIVNPGEAAVEDSKNRWTIAFEFEGVEMPGPDVFDPLGVTDLMTYTADYTRDLSDALGIGHTVDPGQQNVHYGASTPNNVQHNGDEVFYSG